MGEQQSRLRVSTFFYAILLKATSESYLRKLSEQNALNFDELRQMKIDISSQMSFQREHLTIR